MTALYLLACHIGPRARRDRRRAAGELLDDLARMPEPDGARAEARRRRSPRSRTTVAEHQNFLFLARGLQYPMAMEGALKLKEVSYIHAEGYPAGEMKHGPIALIDRDDAGRGASRWTTARARRCCRTSSRCGRATASSSASSSEGDGEIAAKCDDVDRAAARRRRCCYPLLTSIPMQLLSYHIAVRRGCDVDQPRNLAKTVTVE